MPGEARNKVEFGLRNVHYAVITEGDDGAITYGTPTKNSRCGVHYDG